MMTMKTARTSPLMTPMILITPMTLTIPTSLTILMNLMKLIFPLTFQQPQFPLHLSLQKTQMMAEVIVWLMDWSQNLRSSADLASRWILNRHIRWLWLEPNSRKLESACSLMHSFSKHYYFMITEYKTFSHLVFAVKST